MPSSSHFAFNRRLSAASTTAEANARLPKDRHAQHHISNTITNTKDAPSDGFSPNRDCQSSNSNECFNAQTREASSDSDMALSVFSASNRVYRAGINDPLSAVAPANTEAASASNMASSSAGHAMTIDKMQGSGSAMPGMCGAVSASNMVSSSAEDAMAIDMKLDLDCRIPLEWTTSQEQEQWAEMAEEEQMEKEKEGEEEEMERAIEKEEEERKLRESTRKLVATRKKVAIKTVLVKKMEKRIAQLKINQVENKKEIQKRREDGQSTVLYVLFGLCVGMIWSLRGLMLTLGSGRLDLGLRSMIFGLVW